MAEAPGTVSGFAYAEPERVTEGTFNLLALAVDLAHHRAGHGSALVAVLERRLAVVGGRVLLVETSSLEVYAGARGSLHRCRPGC